jgi:hypothetical protein
MIKYRPYRGAISDSLAEQKEFKSIDEMYDYITNQWNSAGYGVMFFKDNLNVSENYGKDERIDWKETRYVCTDLMGDKSYDVQQCIGMCSIEGDSVMTSLYELNTDFKAFVDKYCTKHNLTVEQALEHLIVKLYAEECRKLSERK